MLFNESKRAKSRLGKSVACTGAMMIAAAARDLLARLLLLAGALALLTDAVHAGCPPGSSACVNPSVTLASPVNGASFGTSQSIVVKGRATGDYGFTGGGEQQNYQINRVEVFNGATKLGNASLTVVGYDDWDRDLVDYTYTISPLAAGTYTLKVRAVDSGGSVSSMPEVSVTVANANASPTVTVTNPGNGGVVTVNVPLTLTVSATDSDGAVASVQYFESNNAISGVITSAPFSFAWTPTRLGANGIKAVATDNSGASTTSATNAFTVNDKPTSSFAVSNVNNQNPGSITLTPTASDSVGGIAYLELYVNGTRESSALSPGYAYNISGRPPGTYNIFIRAVDNYNVSTDSATYVWIVNAAPTVRIAAPVNGAVSTAPGSFVLTADAADSDGSVASVQWFANGTAISGALTSAPYTFNWSAVAAGTYSITAKALDNAGGAATSAAINVVSNDAPNVTLNISGAAGIAPGAITLQTSASDSLGGVSSVQYFANGNAISGQLTGAPYTFTWSGVGAGSYNLTARATDGYGLTGTSASYSFTVNAPPSVTVTGPNNNAVLLAPSAVMLTVSAADSDGSISSVQYYLNGAPFGSAVTAAPFSFLWNAPAAGVYSIAARAVDNGGAATTSAAITVTINDRPGVSLSTSAASGVAPGGITLQASASDSQGSVTSVQYFANGSAISSGLSTAPYAFNWTNVAAGNYNIVARATDSYGATNDSAPFAWNVNAPPTVSLTSPSNGAVVNSGLPATISLSAAAADTDGSVTKVEFLVNGTVVAASTTAPFAANWTATAAGGYSLQARATDNAGAVITSGIVLISVDAPPTTSITSPANGATFQPGWDVPVTIAAGDTDGSISKVELYDGGSLVATLTAAPYATTIADVPAGTHTLVAKAYDNQGAITTSAAVTINVAFNAPPISSGNGIPGKLAGSLGVTSGGAAQYNIPIAIPPGVAGMVPSIALTYDSSGGNGVAGVGWSIGGLSQISRCGLDWAHDGLKAGVELSANDRLCLDGQRLVLVSGTYGYSNSEYRAEVDSFAKITLYGAGTDADPFRFEVRLRDGTLMTYGGAGAYRVVLPGAQAASGIDPSVAWMLKAVSDPRGNYYSVTYRTAVGTNQLVPQRISYTANTNTRTKAISSINFVYDDTRTDVETRYVLGVKISNTLRLTNIQTFQAGIVKDYRLSYAYSLPTGRSRIASVTECADTGNTCLPPTTFQWENTPIDFSGPAVEYQPTDVEFGPLAPERGDRGRQYWADVNGDGRPDHCIHNNIINPSSGEYFAGEMYCRISQPGGATPALVKIGNFYANAAFTFVDVNGDGIADVCQLGLCRLMSSSGPTGAIAASAPGNSGPSDEQVDVNGDGRPDTCRVTNDNSSGAPYRLECYLSTGTGWSSAINLGAVTVATCTTAAPCEALRFSWADVSGDGIPSFCRIEGGAVRCRKWTPSGLATEIATGVIDLGDQVGRSWVDVNGDGKADFCRLVRESAAQPNHAPGHIACTLSTGSGFGETIVSGTIDLGLISETSWVDVNGDGRIDYCRQTSARTAFECTLSTGKEFTGTVSLSTSTNQYAIQMVDVNGDGKSDACLGTGPGNAMCRTAAGTYPDLLLSVTDGLGATSSVQYRPISDESVYTKGSGSIFPTNDLQDATHVVRRVTASNGVGGTVDSTYKYEGAKTHLQGRGFLGFSAMVSTDPSGTLSRSELLTDFPYTGLSKRKLVSNGGMTLSETSTTYTANANAPYRVYPTNTVTKTNDLDGSFINWVESSTAAANYDAYGNPLQVDIVYKDANGNADGYSQTSVMAYLNDTTNWILGRPTSLATTSRAPGKPDSTRTTTSSYVTANPGLGLLQQNIVEPNNGGTGATNLRLVTDYTYDAFGNPLTKTVSGANIATRTETTNTYDTQGRGPITVKNALNHLETRTYDWRFGVVTSLQGPNLLTTSWGFDAFGRQLTEDRADGTRTTTTYNVCVACVPGSAYSVGRADTVVSGGAVVSPPSRTYYDTLGRGILSSQAGFAGQEVYRETQYDSLGRVGYASANYFANDSVIRWTQFNYDPLGRTVQTIAPDNSSTTATYSGRTTSSTNDKGVKNSRTANSQGKVISITDAQATADASTVTYEYDPWGNLTKTIDALGNQTTMVYDLVGRKVQLIDPDMGTWTYAVDNLGQVTSQTDAKTQTTSYTYDLLGRMTRRLEPDLDSRWYYEKNAAGVDCTTGIGKLCEATTSNGYYRRPAYDSLGRLSSQTTHVDADYVANWAYDPAGRLSTQTFPASTGAPLAIKYNYTAIGLLQSVGNSATGNAYWTRTAANADGNTTSELYGNGLIGTRGYDSVTGRLTSLQAGTSAAPSSVQNQSYHYDSLGRLDLRSDNTAGVGTSETFGYDGLNRLTTANITAAGTGTLTTSVGFNAIGNITSKSGVGTYTYPAAGSARPHAVSSVSGTVNGVVNPSFGYDSNGNMLTDGARSFTWTSFNMPATLTKTAQAGSPGAGTSTFLYGPEHQRLTQAWVDSGKTLTTVYLDPLFEKESNSQTGITEFKHYVKVGGSIVAVHGRSIGAGWTKIADEDQPFTVSGTQTVRYGYGSNWVSASVTGSGTCSNAFFGNDPIYGTVKQCEVGSGTETVKYLIPDHLGSTSVVTDASGNVIDRQAFDPWGDRRTASGTNAGAADPTNQIQPTSTTRGFTGHEQLDQGNMGLTHMNGRVYDSTLGRFISADPNIQAPFSSQSFSRYSYVFNSPLSATDPTGFLADNGSGNEFSLFPGFWSGRGPGGVQGFQVTELERVTVLCSAGFICGEAAEAWLLAQAANDAATRGRPIGWVGNSRALKAAQSAAAAVIAKYGEAAVRRAFIGLGLLIYSGPGDNGEDARMAAINEEAAKRAAAVAALASGANAAAGGAAPPPPEDEEPSKKKAARNSDVGDKVRTPESHPEDFEHFKRGTMRNKYTGEIWDRSYTTHSDAAGEWKVGSSKGEFPRPNDKITIGHDGVIIKF